MQDGHLGYRVNEDLGGICWGNLDENFNAAGGNLVGNEDNWTGRNSFRSILKVGCHHGKHLAARHTFYVKKCGVLGDIRVVSDTNVKL